MRGSDLHQEGLFSYVCAEGRIPKRHPLRRVRTMVDAALAQMACHFEAAYAQVGRPSIAPEKLIRALLLQIFYSIRSERLRCEQLDYNLLFRWFVGLSMDDPRDGSGEPPAGGGRNAERDCHGERRKHDTHVSTTDPEAKLFRKGPGKEAKLCFMGHLVSENRNGLAIVAQLSEAIGTAERDHALEMVATTPGTQRITLGADKHYDTHRRSAIDARTTRHPGYDVSQRLRKRIEEVFGWAKDIGPVRKTKFRGRERVSFQWVMTLAGYNLVRMRNLLAETPG